MGPDAPISRRALLSQMAPFIRITAPKVPMMEGAGMKKGSVEGTLWTLDAR